MEFFAIPPDLFGGIFLGGVLITVLARGLVNLADVLLNRFGMDLPDADLPGYSLVTAAGMLLVAVGAEILDVAPVLLGFEGLLWKILAGVVLGIGVDKLAVRLGR